MTTSTKCVLKQRADALIAEMEAGTLTVQVLRRELEGIMGGLERKRQDLLYLQTYSSSPESEVIGIALVEAGRIVRSGLDARDWPYQSVLDAVMDGWRIISFPNMALVALSPDEPHGLGFEFILERLS